MSAVRAQAINRFFVELERRYGNLGALVDDAKVVSASRLTTDLCRKLFSHEVLAVRIPLFYSREDCERISNLLLNDTNVANWQVSRGTMSANLPIKPINRESITGLASRWCGISI